MIRYGDALEAEDYPVLHRMLQNTYWAHDRSLEMVVASVERSIVVTARNSSGELVGVARAVTDGVTFSWICDIVVHEACRGQGIGRAMIERLMRHREVSPTRKILVTRDAQGLYSQFGFETHPYECMVHYPKTAQQDGAPDAPADAGDL